MKKEVKMTKGAFVKEHTELLKILAHPTKGGLNKEIKEQGSELKRRTRKK